MFKRMLKVLALCAVLMPLGGCMFDDAATKDQIIRYVNENGKEINAVVAYLQEQPGDWLARQPANEQALAMLKTPEIVKEVSKQHGIIDFYCGGTGIATSSTYTGFYFSPQNTPSGVFFSNQLLQETSPGVYEWQSEDREHRIYTERIIEKWFYYYTVVN